MPLRNLKAEIETLRAIAYIYELTKYVVEKHPTIAFEFNQWYKERRENAKIQQKDNPTNGL